MHPLKIVIAVPGLSSHDAGAREVGIACRDAGMEVILLMRRGLSVEEIVRTAKDEDVNVIGISIHSGSHVRVARKLSDELKKEQIHDVLVVMGGIIPHTDVPTLKDLGVKEVFGPGTRLATITGFINTHFGRPGRAQALAT